MSKHQTNNSIIHYQRHACTAKSPVSTVVFLHGLGSSILDWSEQTPAFTPFYDVLLIDLRGHGLSDKPPGTYSIQQMALDVYTLVRDLELDNIHCVGLSMGAQVALQLALDKPEIVASVTAVNSPADMVPKRFRDKLAILQRKILVNLLGMTITGQVIAKKLLPGDAFTEIGSEAGSPLPSAHTTVRTGPYTAVQVHLCHS
ncbi:MAG: alpha/beta fold hydrolase [Granulosicoccus sp.]